MQFPRPSKNAQAAAVVAAAAIALIAYYALRTPPTDDTSAFEQHSRFLQYRQQEVSAFRADFQAAQYQACLDRLAAQPGAFIDQRVQSAQRNSLELAKSQAYPAVAPDADFLRRRVLYARLVKSLQRDDPRETVMAVFDYVVQNVASVAGPGEKPDIGVMPETVLARGYGVCNRSAWLFCTLLEQLRVDPEERTHFASYILYLRDPETGISHHTIAGVRIDGRVYLFGTYSGLPVLKQNGKIATLEEVILNPADIDSVEIGGLRQLVKGAEVAASILLVAVEPETVHEFSAAAQAALDTDAPILYRDYSAALPGLAGTLWPGVKVPQTTAHTLENPASKNLIKLWDYPFRIGANLRLAKYRDEIDAAHTWLRELKNARLADLAPGNAPEGDPYEGLLEKLDAGSDGREAAEYFRARFLLKHHPSEGEAAAAKFIDDHPASLWRNPILLALGEALCAGGKFDQACEYLELVDGPRKIRAAAFIEAAGRRRLPDALTANALR